MAITFTSIYTSGVTRAAQRACVTMRVHEIRQKSQKFLHKYNKLKKIKVTSYTTACWKCVVFTTAADTTDSAHRYVNRLPNWSTCASSRRARASVPITGDANSPCLCRASRGRNIILIMSSHSFSLLWGVSYCIHIHSPEDATTPFHNTDIIMWCEVTISCVILILTM